MALFQNTSLHILPIMINGVRRNIKPGEQIRGPDSLSSVPGLSLLNSSNKPIILKNDIPPQQLNTIKPVSKSYSLNIPVNESGITDFNKQIDETISYLQSIKEKNTLPYITLAILTKNHLDLIKNCCESIFQKVNYSNIVLMIIDTGTTESSVLQYYSTLENSCNSKNWKFKLIKLDSFCYSKNYNEVIKNYVDTEYVLIQNNDTVAINDYVSEMMSVGIIQKVGSVGCRMFYPDGTIQHDGQTFYAGPNNSYSGGTHLNLRVKKETLNSTEHGIKLVDGNTAAGALMRTKDFLKVDGFDEQYKDIYQDVDLMAKIPVILNKFNYCNRKALIYHIDNATRKAIGLNAQYINHDVNYIKMKFEQNNMSRATLPKTVDFSIITLVRNLDDYKDFLNGLRKQNGQHSIELIAIPNFYNTFTSAFKGLNTGLDVSSGKIIIFCHEDILITQNWLNKIKKHISELTSEQERIGVLGMAGITLSGQSIFYLTNHNGTHINNYGKSRFETQTLDELCLCTLKENNLRFNDEYFDGFHFYGADICLSAKLNNMKNYAIDAECYHKSDGSKNLNTPNLFNIYKQLAEKFMNYAKSKGINSWRTTTANCVNGVLQLFPKSPK